MKRLAMAAAAFLALTGFSLARVQDAPLALVRIADGTYAHFGAIALATAENAGDIANLGIVVSRDPAAVIDFAGSVAVSRAHLAAVPTVSDKPLRYIINTHEAPDHIFGNVVFFGTGATFVGHHNLTASLKARGPFYL